MSKPILQSEGFLVLFLGMTIQAYWFFINGDLSNHPDHSHSGCWKVTCWTLSEAEQKTASSQGAKQKSLHPYAILTVLTSSFFGNILGSWNHGKKKNQLAPSPGPFAKGLKSTEFQASKWALVTARRAQMLGRSQKRLPRLEFLSLFFPGSSCDIFRYLYQCRYVDMHIRLHD